MRGHKKYSWLILAILVFMMALSASAALPEKSSQAIQKATETKAALKPGWHKNSEGYYYVNKKGERVKGWLRVNGKAYFIGSSGYRATGWKRINGKYHYFNSKGVRKSGWLRVGGKVYYCNPSDKGARVTGLVSIGGTKYYFNSRGVRQTGLVKYKSKYYFFQTNGAMAYGWQYVNGENYYFNETTGAMEIGWVKKNGYYYYYDGHGSYLRDQFSPDGYWVDENGHRLRKSTLKKLLKTALKPVGSTMYVWGGGWNFSEPWSGIDATTIGVNPFWQQYFQQQGPNYDFHQTPTYSRYGLDCSGFVGWTLYNTFNKKSGNAGFVMGAEYMAKRYSAKGWGSYTPAGAVSTYRAGDIMSLAEGHVYIVIGTCSDGSVVFVHSSPQGVQINGTYTPSGNPRSQAVSLAEHYMRTYYPAWYAKYPNCSRGTSYLYQYAQMRWYLSGNCMLTDPDGYAGMSGEQVLADLFS